MQIAVYEMYRVCLTNVQCRIIFSFFLEKRSGGRGLLLLYSTLLLGPIQTFRPMRRTNKQNKGANRQINQLSDLNGYDMRTHGFR